MSKRKGVLLTAVVAALLLLTVSVLVACEEEPTTFTVTLRSGFDDAVITETVEEGTSFTLPENTFVRPGYEFTGWTREGSTFLLAPGASSPIYADAVYVANWREEGSGTGGEESFTVVLKFSDDPDASTDRYSGIASGTSFTLPDCVWLNPGYTFAGWQVNGVSMSPGDEITVNGNMEIVAVWNVVSDPGPTEEIYTVTYLDGYSDGMRNVSVSESDGAIYTLPELFEDFARTDKKFVGWKPDNSSDVLSPGAAYPVTSDLTFTAVWEDYKYTVTFLSDDSVVSETEGISSGSFVYAPAAPDKTGYEFKGWKNISAPETVYQPGAAINVSGDLTFEAVWEILTYEITFIVRNQSQTVTVNYGEIPVSPLATDSYQTPSLVYSFDRWEPALEAATENATYTAIYSEATRKYPVTFYPNEYVEFLVNGNAVTEYEVAFGQSLNFTLSAAPGVLLDNVSVYNNDDLLTASAGIYTLPFDTDAQVRVNGWEMAEYIVVVDVSEYSGEKTAVYEIIAPNGYTYGEEITLKVSGAEGYRKYAPEVVSDSTVLEYDLTETIDGIPYYYYNFVLSESLYLDITGLFDTINITYVDIYGNEYPYEWVPTDGRVGSESLLKSLGMTVGTSATYDVYSGNYSYRAYPGIISPNSYVPVTTDPSEIIIILNDGESKWDRIDAEVLNNPTTPTEGAVYYVRYLPNNNSSNVNLSMVVSPNATDIKYYINGISTDWVSWVGQGEPSSLGHIENYMFYTDEECTKSAFSTGQTVYVTMTIPEGEELPALYNELSLARLYPTSKQINGEETACYEIQIGNINLAYLPLDDETYGYHEIMFDTSSEWVELPYSITDVSADKIKNGGSVSFTLDLKTNFCDIASMITDNGDGTYSLKNGIPFEISGNSDYSLTYIITDVTYTMDEIGAKIVFTIDNVTSDLLIYIFDVTRQNRLVPLVIGDYYDYYIDGEKVNGESGTTVLARIYVDSTIEMRLHDEVPYNFVLIQGATAKVYYSYEHIDGQVVIEDIYGGILESRKISYTFSSAKVKYISEFKIDVPFEFRQYEFGYSAEYLESISAEQDGTITILNDDSDPYVDYQNGFVLEVVAPNGTVPVLYVERADMLSDSFRKYYASDKKLQEGEQYMYVYTFTLTDIDSEIRWYLGTEAEVYDITFVYGDSSVIIPVEYGTSINDIADVPTYYVAADDEGQTFYMITAWMNGDTEVSVIDGSVTTLHASGTATDATVSFSYSGGVEFFDNLAAALASDIVKNNSGTLDMFYGKTDESLTEGTFTIPAEVTLRLPYAAGSYGRAYGVTGADGNSPSVFFAEESDGFTSVVIGAGATLEVYGSVSVGGIVGYPASAMPYQGQTSAAHAVLELGGTMNVYSGGRLYVNGYIEGSGTVELETGAASYLPFVVKDYRGGTNSSNVYMEDIAPFNIYEMPNIQTTYIINYGASEYAYAMLYAMNTFNETVAQVIGSDGMIRLSEGGYVEKKTTRIVNPRNETGTDTSVEPAYEHRTTLDIYGGGSDGVLSLSILGLVTVTTGDVYMGIPYTYERITLHGGEYTIHNMFKIMPGSTLEVASGATLEILAGASIAVYEEGFKETSSQLNNRQQLTYPAEPNGYAEGGKLALGGTLTITGSFGGEITADDASGTPTIVVNTSSNASLSVEAVEAVQLNNAEFEYTYQATLIAMAGETQLAPCPPGAPVTYLYSDGVWAIS